MKTSLVTVITAVYNGERVIARTIESLLRQDHKNIQYVVIDGGSTDGTLEAIAPYRPYIDILVSEKDEGIADAWNKGIAQAKGDYIYLLNAGDTIEETFLSTHLSAANLDSISYGITYMTTDAGHILQKIDRKFDRTQLTKGFGFLHTSCFISRRLYQKVGPFDTSFRIAIDTDWLLRALALGVSFQQCGAKNFMEIGGVSEAKFFKAQCEYIRALRAHGFVKNYAHYLTIIARAKVFEYLRKFRLISFKKRVRGEFLFMGLAGVNSCLSIIPIWYLRRLLLKMVGVSVGKGSIFHRKIRLFSYGNLIVGDNSIINRGCYLDNRFLIKIGHTVSIAHDVKIYTTGHDIEDPAFCLRKREVIIDDGVVIFAGAVIMPGVHIGRNAVILPYAVVAKNVEAQEVVGGNPAVNKGRRSLEAKYKMNYPFWYSQ